MKRDKEYFRRLNYYKKMVEDYFRRRGETLNKYQLVSLVSSYWMNHIDQKRPEKISKS